MLSLRRQPLNASRVHLDRFVASAGRAVPAGGLILDAGAGHSPYRTHFQHARYESADFAKVTKDYADDLTYVCDLADVPVEDARYNVVVLTQVLEHLSAPTAALREMRRVLKPGGTIWASCPLYYEEHEQPYDFYRYTQFALRRMFDDAGFVDVDIEWLEGYLGTVAYQLDLMARTLPSRARLARLPLRLASEICARRDVKSKFTSGGHPKNYSIVARRPA